MARRDDFVAVIALFFTVAGCTDDMLDPKTVQMGASFALAMPLGRPRTMHDEFLDLAKRAKGFAGVFLDADGELTINTAGRSFSEANITEVVTWLQTHTRFRNSPRPRLRTVALSYDALDSLERVIVAALHPVSFIRSWGVDGTHDQVFFTVTTPAGVDSILHVTARLGVPTPAVSVTLEPSRDRMCEGEQCGGGGGGGGAGGGNGSPPSPTLHDVIRPTMGGTLLSAGIGYCTLGFSGYSFPPSGRPDVFLTAGHCTASGNPGELNNTVIGQGSPSFPRIGIEIRQAPVYPVSHPYCTFYGALPAQATHCTFADAMVGRYDDSVLTGGYGVVEKTAILSPPPAQYAPVITGLTGTIGNLYGALDGETIYMVGAFSGTQRGVVVHSCVSFTTNQEPSFFVICAGRGSYCSQNGDSGAPVFMPYDPSYPNPTPREVGVHVASFPNCGDSFYDNFGGIFNAFGYNYLW